MINSKSDIFDKISDMSIKKINENSKIIKYSKNEIIHFIGDKCRSIDFIVDGSVEGEHIAEDGSRMIVRIFNRNEAVGLNVAFSSNPIYAINFVASENVEIISVETNALFKLMIEDTQLMKNILKNLSDNSIRIGSRVKNNFRVTIKTQLLSYIHTLYVQQKTNPIIIPISKLKLSEYFGVSRTSLSRVFSNLEKEGLIKLDNKNVYLGKVFKSNI